MNNENKEVVRGLADKDIVSAQLFKLVCEAMTIRRYGLAACNAEVESEGRQ